MQRERTRHHVVAGHGIGNQLLGQLRALTWRNQPADDVPAKNIQDDVGVDLFSLPKVTVGKLALAWG